ncbi:hypothetical protein BpHYR1_035726 [Brachionus plicatilis]|uniref:Uncharacterized protein n=1 Tax=Brachionus plicatilis TaxID=10195 RepID=A0A3M7SZC0_BRAPC|nr:hypothetical protein BpHYR1_035726 [Brachionus plicatilis]
MALCQFSSPKVQNLIITFDCGTVAASYFEPLFYCWMNTFWISISTAYDLIFCSLSWRCVQDLVGRFEFRTGLKLGIARVILNQVKRLLKILQNAFFSDFYANRKAFPWVRFFYFSLLEIPVLGKSQTTQIKSSHDLDLNFFKFFFRNFCPTLDNKIESATRKK